MITEELEQEPSDKDSHELDLSDVTFDSDSYSDSSSNQVDDDPLFLEELDLLTKLGPAGYVSFQRQSGKSPQQLFCFFGAHLPEEVNFEDDVVWGMLERLLLRHYYERQPLQVDGFRGFADVLRKAKNIVVVVGAGISVSCGVPDFRSPKTGLYSLIKQRFPELQAPEDIFDLQLFRENPRPFYTIARELINETLSPSPTHHFLKWLESEGKILRIFTQNIDCLEKKAGLEKVCYCHGSFLTSTCIQCGQKYDFDDLVEWLREEESLVPTCSCGGVVKPDIVFFGESLPEHFDQCVATDLKDADCFIVGGSSMKVYPVSALPDFINPQIPQFIINKTPLYDHNYDLQLLGDADVVTDCIKRLLVEDKMSQDCTTIDRWVVFPGVIIEDQCADSQEAASDDESDNQSTGALQSADASTQ
jgi:NAD-dependent deacetylase sirtuin 1